MTTATLPPICGAIKLVPLAFLPVPAQSGTTHAAMTCVREPGHPERDADSSLHLCGTFAWAVGPGDDYRETDEYRALSEQPTPEGGEDRG